MDFFAAQEKALQRTKRLVVMFGLAVAGTVAACYAIIAWVFVARHGGGFWAWWEPGLFLKVAGVVLLVVGAAAGYKWRQYSAGGAAVAESAGGRRVEPNTSRTDERRLLNVVEEMAIASGLPVPAVFVLDGESGINAFAAGLTPADAAVAVTQGALEQLTRDELQGVIAHEFSHILNGDMRLNLKLGALVFGILVIGLTGRGILWSLRGIRLRGKNNGGVILLIVAAGVALLVIGYIGYFFGRLAQAAISRQREFLADASAVQFTRNPDGILSALRRIAQSTEGSQLQAAKAEALGHFLFAQGFRSWLGGLWATHPDIQERINAIAPQSIHEVADSAPGEGNVHLEGTASFGAAACLGSLTATQVARASALIAIIPHPLREAAREPAGAAALLVWLGLSSAPEARQRQNELIDDHRDYLNTLEPALRLLRPALRLPLARLALASLRQQESAQKRRLLQTLDRVTRADEEVSLFEFTLMAMARRELEIDLGERIDRTDRKPAEVAQDVAAVLSAVALSGAENEAAAKAAFSAGTKLLTLPPEWIGFVAKNDFSRLGEGLERIAAGSLNLRQQVVRAGAAIIDADGMRTPEEIELLRVIAATLGCPMSLAV